MCQGMDPVDYIHGHGKLCGIGAVNDTAGREAEEIKISLNITGRSHGKGSNSAGHHAVVVLLMGLNMIFTVLIVTMAVVIDGLTSDDGAGAQTIGNPIWVRE